VQTGAALMPATLWFDGDGWGVYVHEEIPVPAEGDRWQKAAVMTQQMARVFEEGIRRHPADWHMLSRVFVADLDPDRLASARARVAARERAAQRSASVTNTSAGSSDASNNSAGNGSGSGVAGHEPSEAESP
jgi:hypothetical protein